MIAGRYALEREVGRGGMGAVWLGRDEVLGRPVALKQIGRLPGLDHTDLDRAEREAQVSARLHHPHVVAVFDLVIDGDDRWLVMEYVRGRTLAQLVRDQGRLAPDEAAALLAQVADALVAAHASGIVHRDVKPSNVLVGDDGVAKLSDFGIARRSGDSSLTQTGQMIGSPTYLAPEVASGERGDVAADVWAFGATLYYALAGRPPYESNDNVLSTLYRIVHDDPDPIDGAGWLAPVLAGTLEKDPAHRWSMARVRAALAGAAPPATSSAELTAVVPLAATRVQGVPAPAGPPPAGAPDRSRVPTEMLLLAAAVLVVAGVVAYVVLSGGGGRQPAADHTTASTPASPTASASPTAAGMEAFIRDYVATVSTDPDRAWTMLTPKFRRESGGLDRYRAFWGRATHGRVLDIAADPAKLSVSYHVHFDHFDNGPGPTVLDLVYRNGSYRIDGERTRGFEPAG